MDFSTSILISADLAKKLFVNLNDSPERWWGRTIKNIIKKYDKSYVLTQKNMKDLGKLLENFTIREMVKVMEMAVVTATGTVVAMAEEPAAEMAQVLK